MAEDLERKVKDTIRVIESISVTIRDDEIRLPEGSNERALKEEERKAYETSLSILGNSFYSVAEKIEGMLPKAKQGEIPAYRMTLSILYKRFPELISQTSPRDLYD